MGAVPIIKPMHIMPLSADRDIRKGATSCHVSSRKAGQRYGIYPVIDTTLYIAAGVAHTYKKIVGNWESVATVVYVSPLSKSICLTR